ncbi:Cochaperone protein [Friedmanniomyces endolithicus]|uniref:Cochaperone protein n=1 Tax=Rachicladosporium monterosium TaxID=1507873 RepID=A0ABR0LEP1_9PEZI|nr:Cochaperone protein [Friedmanniomyces endolithicus]KAK5147675.1 Cochaperone protein [Rachicladosporium monterosium]
MDQSALGKKALSESNYVDAIKHYTAALQQSPTSPAYLIQRATAYQRNKEYSRALNDANRAVLEARKRAKREQIIEAQFRRGVALYSLERYGDAEFVLKVVKRMDEKFKGLELWINKTKLTLSKLGTEEEGKRLCKVGEVPEEGDDVPTDAARNAGAAATDDKVTGDKIRHEWYQNSQNVYFTLLAKGVPSDQAQIDFTPRSLNISFPLATGASYDFTLEPLFAEIDPEACTKRVLSTKIEIGLAKKVHGKKWRALESDTPTPEKTDSVTSADHDAVKAAVLSHPPMSTGPVYPTSSKSGPKDWDKVTTDALRDPSAKPGTAGEDEDFEGGDESNLFFKKLFKGSTPEVQRAMMKSYTESNGTALSTNWEEVSKGKVETSPPDGMQAREWDS